MKKNFPTTEEIFVYKKIDNDGNAERGEFREESPGKGSDGE